MAKVEKIEWKSFMKGDVVSVEKKALVLDGWPSALATFALTPIVAQAIEPHFVHAAVDAVPAMSGGTTWNHAISGIRSVSDWLCYGCIVFAGWTWMFGNRTKAIEVITGSAIGIIIINHAQDIERFLVEV